jgi:hypothetical protein
VWSNRTRAFEQFATKERWAFFVRVDENENGVRLPKERDLDVMLDSKLVLAVVSDLERTFARGAHWSVDVDLDVTITAKGKPALQEDRDSGYFPMAFHDRHDDIPGHRVTGS